MLVLGCDPSLTGFGWTIVDTEKEGRDRLVDYGTFKTKASQLYVSRYMFLRESINEVVEDYQPDFAGTEHPPYHSQYSAGLYALYIGVSEVFYRHRLDFAIFMPTQLKAFVRDILDDTGKMHKSDMKDATRQLLGGWKGRFNNNVADAFLIGYHAGRFKRLVDGDLTEDDLSPKEAQAFTKTVKRRKTGKIDKVGMLYREEDRYFLLSDEKYDHLYDDTE